MKTQAWKPSTTSDTPKQGIYVDELVQFCEISSGAVGEIPAVAAFLLAVELVAKKQPFEIRDIESFEVWLKSDGEKLSGAHSMQQVIHDTAEILDAIVNKNVKVFADNLRNVIDQSAAALRQQVQSARPEAPPVEVATKAEDAVSEQPAVTAPSEALAQPQPAPETLG
jgi:hypothetical protein